MHRVFLKQQGTGHKGLDLDLVRQAIVAIVLMATGGSKGRGIKDPIHNWVTENRRKQYEVALKAKAKWALNMKAGYSSCGDLWAFVLMLLGVRDERFVNRGDDGGIKDWVIGANLSVLTNSELYVKNKGYDIDPEPGDFLHLVGAFDHATILVRKVSDEVWETGDYGQPHGKTNARKVERRMGFLYLDGRRVAGTIPVANILPLIVESTILPDDVHLGVEDDNPYPEDVVPPPGVAKVLGPIAPA